MKNFGQEMLIFTENATSYPVKESTEYQAWASSAFWHWKVRRETGSTETQ